MADINKLPSKDNTLEEVLDIWMNGWFIHKRENSEWYMNEYFTKEEAVRHADNLSGWLPHEGDIAHLKLMLMSAGFDLQQKSELSK